MFPLPISQPIIRLIYRNYSIVTKNETSSLIVCIISYYNRDGQNASSLSKDKCEQGSHLSLLKNLSTYNSPSVTSNASIPGVSPNKPIA